MTWPLRITPLIDALYCTVQSDKVIDDNITTVVRVTSLSWLASQVG
jgi:hypothetical protein